MSANDIGKTITIKANSISKNEKIDSFFGRFSQQDEEYLVEYVASINDDSSFLPALGGVNTQQSIISSSDHHQHTNSSGIVLVLSKQL